MQRWVGSMLLQQWRRTEDNLCLCSETEGVACAAIEVEEGRLKLVGMMLVQQIVLVDEKCSCSN